MGSLHDNPGSAKPAALSTEAFSSLSQKIEARLSTLNDGITNKKRKREKSAEAKQRPNQAKKKTAGQSKSNVPSGLPTKLASELQQHGVKRTHTDGEGEKDRTKATKTRTHQEPTTGITFEEEVYSLGGTKEDIALVASINSDSELEQESALSNRSRGNKFDQGLMKGIVAIVKDIDNHESSFSTSSNIDETENGKKDLEEGNNDSRKSLVLPEMSSSGASNTRSEKSALLVAPCSEWFNIPLPETESISSPGSHLSPSDVKELYERAKSLLEVENEAFKVSQRSVSSRNFYSTVISSGTLSDKISALTLAVQESPIHNLRALETLINLGKKRSRAQAVDVLRALKDLFAQGSLLPSHRKLHIFSTHPLVLAALDSSKSRKAGSALKTTLEPQQLILCAYESWLKEKYFEVLQTLEIWCNDEIEFSRSKAVCFVFELLKEKPEQESNLLRMLTNKLGDPSKKIASQASYLLMELMGAHPLMKLTIVASVESDVLFRPGQSLHAKYYAIITLNQTVLSVKEEELASKLLDLYFGLFVTILRPAEVEKNESIAPPEHDVKGRNKKKPDSYRADTADDVQAGDLREKLTSAILTGINRAHPYTSSYAQSMPSHMDTLFKVTHSSNFNTSIQALMLIQQLCSSHQASGDRFYRTLYESLLDSRLINSSKHSLYLNLLYRALKADTNAKRVTAFVKRIFQLLNLHQPPFICGCLFLIEELKNQFPSLNALINQPEEYDFESEQEEDAQQGMDPRRFSQTSTTRAKYQIYDSRKRDPGHSNAENSCLWEALPFLAHFHPSVSVSAEQMVSNAKLSGKPDLELHTLMHFLDRFVYRNAKAGVSKPRGSSIMQPLASNNTTGLLVSSAAHHQPPVNSERFWTSKREDVAAEDTFFHQYFSSVGKTGQVKKADKKSSKVSGDDEDATSESGESEIWNAMMESAPDLEGIDDSDQDLEMSDLESLAEGRTEEATATLEESDEVDASDQDSAADSDSPAAFLTSDGAGPSAALATKVHSGKAARRKLKNLPTFASASDYAEMIDNEADEDQGG